MTRKAMATIFTVAAGAAIVWAAAIPSQSTDAVDRSPDATAQTPGYTVHFDESGRIAETPQATNFHEALSGAANTSTDGLVERRNTAPGGGYVVELDGRFQNTYVATTDGAGNVEASCLTNETDAAAVEDQLEEKE